MSIILAGIYAYVSLKESQQPSDALRKELVQTVRKEIGGVPCILLNQQCVNEV